MSDLRNEAAAPAPSAGLRAVVIDTNVALDLLLFEDPAARPLGEELEAGRLHWLATAAMRDELARVLGYERLRRRFAVGATPPIDVLCRFDALVCIVEPPLRAHVACRDPDDQKFVDLAVARRCLLLSKDRDLLSLRKRLAMLQVATAATLAAHNVASFHRRSAP